MYVIVYNSLKSTLKTRWQRHGIIVNVSKNKLVV